MKHLAGVLAIAALAGCALRPAGEDPERERAAEAGRPYESRGELPGLDAASGPEDYLQYAFLANADLEVRYWQWRAALEQIPQDSSFPNVAVSFGYMFSRDQMKSWDRTTLGVGNDPMSNIPFPTKLSTAGRIALENARAAGERFTEAKFLLQGKVLATYYDLALLGESLRIQRETLELLRQMLDQADVRARTGAAAQQDLLKAQTELDFADNALQTMDTQRPILAARMNALLGRPARSPVPPPERLPAPRELPVGDEALLDFGSDKSPELAALAKEVAGRKEALSLARQAYLPDFGLSASLTGNVSKALMGMATLPLRLEAIQGGIEQAHANLRGVQAARIQYERDLTATFVLNLTVLRNDERQIALFEKTLLPRARQTVEAAQSSYAAGRLAFGELLEAQRTYLDVRQTLAQLRMEREKALAAIETWSTVDVEVMGAPRMAGGRSGASAMPSSPGTRRGSTGGTDPMK